MLLSAELPPSPLGTGYTVGATPPVGRSIDKNCGECQPID